MPDKGFYVRYGGDTMPLAPPFVSTPAEVDRLVSTLGDTLDATPDRSTRGGPLSFRRDWRKPGRARRRAGAPLLDSPPRQLPTSRGPG